MFKNLNVNSATNLFYYTLYEITDLFVLKKSNLSKSTFYGCLDLRNLFLKRKLLTKSLKTLTHLMIIINSLICDLDVKYSLNKTFNIFQNIFKKN